MVIQPGTCAAVSQDLHMHQHTGSDVIWLCVWCGHDLLMPEGVYTVKKLCANFFRNSTWVACQVVFVCRGGLAWKKIAVQKIMVEYLAFQPGDLLPWGRNSLGYSYVSAH